jgi:hypothetical protein
VSTFWKNRERQGMGFTLWKHRESEKKLWKVNLKIVRCVKLKINQKVTNII